MLLIVLHEHGRLKRNTSDTQATEANIHSLFRQVTLDDGDADGIEHNDLGFFKEVEELKEMDIETIDHALDTENSQSVALRISKPEPAL